MTMKRIFLAVLAAATILSGCNSAGSAPASSAQASGSTPASSAASAQAPAEEKSYFNAEGLPIVNEPITLTTLYPRRPEHPDSFDDMWFNKELEKRTGIRIQYDLVESAGYQERKNLLISSGDYPDIFLDGITKEDENLYGPQGIFVSLTPYIDQYAVNMLALMEQYPDVRKSLSYEDGAIYNMPCFNIVPRDQFSSAAYIDTEWLDRVGKQMPQTLDEFYDVLLAFRDQDANGNGDPGDEIPYSAVNIKDLRIQVLSALGLPSLEYDVVMDDRYQFAPMTDAYKEFLKYANKLYTEGLIDKDIFILTQEEENVRIQQKIVGCGMTAPYPLFTEDSQWIDVYKCLPMMTSALNSEKMWPAKLRHTRDWGNFVMTDHCQYPEAAVRMIDYFYSDEGTLMVRSGPEEGTWDGEGGWKIVKDENGKEKSVITWPDKFTSFYAFRLYNAPLNMPYSSSENMNFVMISGDYKNSWQSETQLETGRKEAAKVMFPEVTYTEEEQEQLNVYVDIQNYVEQTTAKFIMGDLDIDSGWDKYLQDLNSMSIQEVISIRQAAYDRWNAN